MQKKIIYKEKYISIEDVNKIRGYYEKINDSLYASKGPYPIDALELGYQGCWDRQLHYELDDSPVHNLVKKLKHDFGDFHIYESSIRYLSAPFIPHSDVRSIEWLKQQKNNGFKEGYIFIIPLWWRSDYSPGTAFFNCPPKLDEPLYSDCQENLPKYKKENDSKNFSVRRLIKWESPGDLIGWENFQWHSSCHFNQIEYSKDTWVKEFISFETCLKV